MIHVSDAMAAVWRLTGLETLTVRRTVGDATTTATSVRSSRLSGVYATVVYAAYAFLCAAFTCHKWTEYAKPSEDPSAGAKLQILLIRDGNMALLFIASTAVYWCAAAYRRVHWRVYDEHAAVVRRLFDAAVDGRRQPPLHLATDACCWALYAALAVALSVDVYRYAGPAPWTFAVVYSWGHYALLTGNVQFAVTVFGLLRCYRELNGRMRAGGAARRNAFAFGRHHRCDSGGGGDGAPAKNAFTTTSSPDVLLHDVTFVKVLDNVNLLTMLKYWSDLHWSITQNVSRVNNLFKFRLFVFFLCGLLHLMYTPYLLSLSILNEDVDILSHIIERTLWFVIHMFRVVLMIYPCALLGEEAAETQILLGSYLNTKINFSDIKKVETYAQLLDANKPEFSIYSMFVVDRQLVITLTGAVATYLVIILQL